MKTASESNTFEKIYEHLFWRFDEKVSNCSKLRCKLKPFSCFYAHCWLARHAITRNICAERSFAPQNIFKLQNFFQNLCRGKSRLEFSEACNCIDTIKWYFSNCCIVLVSTYHSQYGVFMSYIITKPTKVCGSKNCWAISRVK